jgi:hypothetical protein
VSNNVLTNEQIRTRIEALKNAAGNSLCSTFAMDAHLLEELLTARTELQELRRSYLALRGENEDLQAQVFEAENQADTTPQPVLTAPEIIPDTLRDEIIDMCRGYEIGDLGAQEIWEACRATMLNGGKS